MNIPHIDTAEWDYELPDERIARYPLPERDQSKLLVYRNGEIKTSQFQRVGQYLPNSSMLVFNNTKVIRARLKFKKETGAQIEIFCLEPIAPAEVQEAFVQTSCTTWKCIVGNSKKWKDGCLKLNVATSKGSVELRATRCASSDNTSQILFSWANEDVSFAELIENAGVTPIPPYLCRETEEIDTTRYQTVYSLHKGSVAAPTAGLHFTKELMQTVRAQGHELVNVTLHVGAGTFKPVQTTDTANHVMHTEHIVVSLSAIEAIAQTKNDIIAVGTTSVRTLESLYWMGVKLVSGQQLGDELGQWEAYNLPQDVSRQAAYSALAVYLKGNNLEELHSATQIMIVPGYKFRVISGLITNFHQPHSTLLLLIGALVGQEWKRIYRYALDNDYRFLSYGDSSLLMALTDNR